MKTHPLSGAEMLSLMLGFGLISRLLSGVAADRIGGLATLLIGSALQAVALVLYVAFDGLVSLYVISALFGLFQGGLVTMYAIIVREYFAPAEAATRLGVILMASTVGMALGGWMSGAIFDLFGSYRAAFLNGLAWNLVNLTIASWLLMRSRRRAAFALGTRSPRHPLPIAPASVQLTFASGTRCSASAKALMTKSLTESL